MSVVTGIACAGIDCMTREQMIAWLEQRYTAESLRWPLLPANVTQKQYIAANLPHMLRSSYWRQREVDQVSR